MSGEPPYVLDANVFIEAARRYYAFDLAPAFWKSLVHYAAVGRVKSIDRVQQELERGNDDLAQWVKKGNFGSAFASTDDSSVIQAYSEIISWVQHQAQFLEAAKSSFADSADGWLVAYAKAQGGIVVTQEVLQSDARSRVKIPNVCQAFGVSFVGTFEVLRSLNIRFS
ncbi:MAG: DUF4411 family protein [Terriglobia bacterium]